ncbi:hypothetical protein ACHAXT_003187 [Thalassiosira profunda]
MNYCNLGAAGPAGVLRMMSSGALDAHLDTRDVLDWAEMNNNTAAILSLAQQHLHCRKLAPDERQFLFSTVQLIGNDDLGVCQSQTTAGTRMNRGTITFQGHTENKFPANYVRDKTQRAVDFVGAYKTHLATSNNVLECSNDATSYLLAWLKGPQTKRRDRLKPFMQIHVDQKSIDVAADGTPNRSTVRGVTYFGRPSTIRMTMMLVWGVPTGRVLPNRRREYVERRKTVGHCEIPLPDLLGVYFFSNIGAGREVAGAMVDPADGIRKAVVWYHGSAASDDGDDGTLVARGIINTDRVFDTPEAADRYFDDMKQGNAAPFNSGAFSGLDLSAFGADDDDETAAALIDHILRSVVMFEPPVKDHQKRASQALSTLTPWNAMEVYENVATILSTDSDGSAVAKSTETARWVSLRKRHGDDELFHLVEEMRSFGASLINVVPDEPPTEDEKVYASLTEGDAQVRPVLDAGLVQTQESFSRWHSSRIDKWRRLRPAKKKTVKKAKASRKHLEERTAKRAAGVSFELCLAHFARWI